MEMWGVIGVKKKGGKEKEKDTTREGSKGMRLSWVRPALWLV